MSIDLYWDGKVGYVTVDLYRGRIGRDDDRSLPWTV